MTDIVLAAIVLAPAALTFLLKSNAAAGFLTVCMGFVLSVSVIGDLQHLLGQMDLSASESNIAVIVLTAPLLLTLLFTRRSAGSGIKYYLQLLAALCAGALLALSLDQIISWQAAGSQLWEGLQSLQSVVIGVGAFLSLLLIWTAKTPHTKKHK